MVRGNNVPAGLVVYANALDDCTSLGLMALGTACKLEKYEWRRRGDDCCGGGSRIVGSNGDRHIDIRLVMDSYNWISNSLKQYG